MFLPGRLSARLSAAIRVNPRASSSSRKASAPASEVMVPPPELQLQSAVEMDSEGALCGFTHWVFPTNWRKNYFKDGIPGKPKAGFQVLTGSGMKFSMARSKSCFIAPS